MENHIYAVQVYLHDSNGDPHFESSFVRVCACNITTWQLYKINFKYKYIISKNMSMKQKYLEAIYFAI